MRDYAFGNFICALRRERKLSQSELGELVGVSNKAVSKWENGASKPPMDTLKKLADIFDVTVEELLNGGRQSETGLVENTRETAPAGAQASAEAAPSAPPPVDLEKASAVGEKRCVGRPRVILFIALAVVLVLLLTAVTVVAVHWWQDRQTPGEEPTENAGENSGEASMILDLQTVKRSVVKIETDLATGSGFCAFEKDLIVTNHHVIKGAKKIEIIDDSGNKTEIKEILFGDEEQDIAILRTSGTFAPLSLGDGHAIRLKDDVTVIGSPKGVLNTVSVGIISNPSYEEYIVISAPASPGSSGGALFNSRYEVIGIIKGTANDEMAQNLNFAINVEKLKAAYGDYEKGKYEAPVYPPKDDTDQDSPAGGSGTATPPEFPDHLVQNQFEYIKKEKVYRTTITLISNEGHYMTADVEIGFVITNTEGVVVYDDKKNVKKSDFTDVSYAKSVVIDLPILEITAGNCATGSVTVTLFYEGRETDSITYDIERGLPVAEISFASLHYAGNGVGSVAGIDFPYGTYNIIFTHEGTGAFEVELNGRTIVRQILPDTVHYLYQLKPAEDSRFAGTPLKNAVFNIICADGAWTMTVERANTAETGRAYVDGQTYAGKGTGYVKDIYLPEGTYNITLTHDGEGMFEIELDGRDILCQHGKISYVYTLKPAEGMYDLGTPMLSACFNITVADGAWSITIRRVE